MKREALLDCLASAQARYDQAWARTSVDLAVQAQAQPAPSQPPPLFPVHS